MKADTKYFGPIEFTQEDILHFPKGLFGFEDEHEFLVLPFAGDGKLYCLQSIATPHLAFVAMDPFVLKAGYAPVLEEEELKELGKEKSEDLFYYALCAVKNPVAESTVNLKCPIAINDESRVAVQVILGGDEYHMRHRLAEFGKDGAPC